MNLSQVITMNLIAYRKALFDGRVGEQDKQVLNAFFQHIKACNELGSWKPFRATLGGPCVLCNPLHDGIRAHACAFACLHVHYSRILHTPSLGPTGTGKTTMALLLARGIDMLLDQVNGWKLVNGNALNAENVGCTTGVTNDCFASIGTTGTILIDEAYGSMSHKRDKGDHSYAAEVATALITCADAHFLVSIILMGYDAEVRRFMKLNQGIASYVHSTHTHTLTYARTSSQACICIFYTSQALACVQAVCHQLRDYAARRQDSCWHRDRQNY